MCYRLLQDDFRRRSLHGLHFRVHGLVVRVRRLLDDDQPRLLHLCRRLLWHRLHYLQRRSRLRQRHGLGGQHRLRLRCRPDARRGLERSRRHWHAFRLHCLRYRLLQDCLGQLFVHGLRLCVRGGHELRVDCLLFNVKPRLRYVRGSLLWQHLRGDGVHHRCQPRLQYMRVWLHRHGLHDLRHKCGLLGLCDVRQRRLRNAAGLRGRLYARCFDEYSGRLGNSFVLHRVRVRLLQDGCGQRSVRCLRRLMLRLELCVDGLHDDHKPRLLRMYAGVCGQHVRGDRML